MAAVSCRLSVPHPPLNIVAPEHWARTPREDISCQMHECVVVGLEVFVTVKVAKAFEEERGTQMKPA